MPHHKASYKKVTQMKKIDITHCFINNFFKVTIEWVKTMISSSKSLWSNEVLDGYSKIPLVLKTKE
jgi:hypothetical protein